MITAYYVVKGQEKERGNKEKEISGNMPELFSRLWLLKNHSAHQTPATVSRGVPFLLAHHWIRFFFTVRGTRAVFLYIRNTLILVYAYTRFLCNAIR